MVASQPVTSISSYERLPHCPSPRQQQPHSPLTKLVTILLISTLILLCLTTTSHAQSDVGNEDYNPTTMMYGDILSQHGAFRYLNQDSYVGSTSRTRIGDTGALLLLNSTQDIALFIKVMGESSPEPLWQRNSTQINKYTILLPPNLFTTPHLTQFNTTTDIAKQIATDLQIVGIISYLSPLVYHSNTLEPSALPAMINLAPKQPFLSLYPTEEHREFEWNPSGTDLINTPFLFPISFLTKHSEINLLINMGSQNWAKFVQYVTDKDQLKNQFYLPHTAQQRYYNSAHKNATHCLSINTCSPVGGYNILSVISQPNWVPKQKWIYIPIPYNTRGLITDLSFDFLNTQSTLILMMAVAKTMTQYYNATIIPALGGHQHDDPVINQFLQGLNQHSSTHKSTDNANPDPTTPQQLKIVFGLVSGDSYDFIGTRSLLDDLWTSLSFRTTNTTAAAFDEMDTIPPETSENAEFYPCTNPVAGISKPPLAPYLNTTQVSCFGPKFRTQTAMFQGLDLRNLDTILQINAPLDTKLYAHIEHHGIGPDERTEVDAMIKAYDEIARNVEIFNTTSILSIDAVDDNLTPGLPPTSAGIMAYNMTYTSEAEWQKYKMTKGPKSLVFSNYATSQSNNLSYQYTPFSTVAELGSDQGHNVLCGHATAFTRLLLKLSNSIIDETNGNPFHPNDDPTPSKLQLKDVKVDCALILTLIHCFTSNRSCEMLTSPAEKFAMNVNTGSQTSPKYKPSSPSSLRQAQLNRIAKELPLSLHSGVYYPKNSIDIDGFPKLLYHWFYLSGYYTSYSSNKYNSTMAWDYVPLPKPDDTVSDGGEQFNVQARDQEEVHTVPANTNHNTIYAPSDPDSFGSRRPPTPPGKFRLQPGLSSHLKAIADSLWEFFMTPAPPPPVLKSRQISDTAERNKLHDKISASIGLGGATNNDSQAVPQSESTNTKSKFKYRSLNPLFHDVDIDSFIPTIPPSPDATIRHLTASLPSEKSNENRLIASLANSIGQDASGDEDDEQTKQRKWNLGLTLLLQHSRFAYFHDAVDPYLNLDLDNDEFSIDKSYWDVDELHKKHHGATADLNPQQATPIPPKPNIWVESIWDRGVGLQVYTRPDFVYHELAILCAGVAFTIIVLIIGICVRRWLNGPMIYNIAMTPQLQYQLAQAENNAQQTRFDYRGIVTQARKED